MASPNSESDIGHVGFELWIVNNGTIFDNILVTDDLEYAQAQGKKLWEPTSEGEKDVKEKWDKENKVRRPRLPSLAGPRQPTLPQFKVPSPSLPATARRRHSRRGGRGRGGRGAREGRALDALWENDA